jgi:hypothetical protein
MKNVCGWFLGALVLAGCTITAEDPRPAPSSGTRSEDDGMGGGPSGGGGATPNTSGKARVRVIHASPDAPAVDVYVKGIPTPVISALSYGNATKYLEIDPGSYEFELRAAPSKPSDPVAYATGPLAVAPGSKTSAIAAGLLGSTDAASKFRVLALADADRTVAKGKTFVRIVHASADAPSVGIDVGDDDPAAPEIADLARFDDVDGVLLPAGAPLQIGVGAGGKRVTAFTTPKLPDGDDVTVIATGLLGKLPRDKGGFSLLAVAESGAIGFIRQNPLVYAVHGGVDAPAVDVYTGTDRVIQNLSFGQLAGPLQVPPGDLNLRVFAAGANPLGAPAAEPTLGNLQGGERYLAIATGYLAPPAGAKAFQVLSFAEGFALDDAQNTRARAVHACPNAPAVDIGPFANGAITPAIANLPFGSGTDRAGLPLPAPQVLLGVAPADADDGVLARFTTPTPAGARSFVVALGALGHSTRPLRLALVETSASPWRISHVFAH